MGLLVCYKDKNLLRNTVGLKHEGKRRLNRSQRTQGVTKLISLVTQTKNHTVTKYRRI